MSIHSELAAIPVLHPWDVFSLSFSEVYILEINNLALNFIKMYTLIYVSCMAKKELKMPDKSNCYAYQQC